MTAARSTKDGKLEGIDWTASYDVDAADLGAFNFGWTGTYYLHNLSQTLPGAAVSDATH